MIHFVSTSSQITTRFQPFSEHKFRHSFADAMNPLCSCDLEIESTEYYIISCHNSAVFRTILMNELKSIINSKFNTLELHELIRTILYADKNFVMTQISRNIHFIKQTQGFEPALYGANKICIYYLTL